MSRMLDAKRHSHYQALSKTTIFKLIINLIATFNQCLHHGIKTVAKIKSTATSVIQQLCNITKPAAMILESVTEIENK